MKKVMLIFIFTFIISFSLFAQPVRPRILGVVMGISKYQNVPSLKYADRDAISFYNFLLSPAGGGADTNNIRLLLNEKATSYNFFEAMDNLLDMAKEGDQVYIYFAGHGDIEKKTDKQNGFLIGYNAPPNCYAAGGCIGVKYLQDYVETLVTTKKSKVTMIIDACRSGKLAGGSQGAEITALALQAEWKGVTKILSCQPGETSLEGEQWGGGGGVFTYFMLKGMLGQADEDGDSTVSVMELNNFLDKNVLRETNKKQLPTIIGDRRQNIVRVDKKSALAMLNQMEHPLKLPPVNQSAGFEADKSTINDIAVLKEYEKFKFYINTNNLLAYNDNDMKKETALSIYRSLERQRSALPIIAKMKGELLAALQNKAQMMMNGWINGNPPESVFEYAREELRIAYSLVDSTSPQYSQVKYRYLFWNAIEELDLKKKIALLEECIKINPDEPFAYLSLGVKLDSLKQYEKAIINFDKAIELSNHWSWAWFNKGRTLRSLGKNEDAIVCFDEVIKLKPDYYNNWNFKGSALSDLGKYNDAIKCFDEAIKINPDLHDAWYNKGNALFRVGNSSEAIKCFDVSLKINPKYIPAWNNKGVAYNNLGEYEEAIKCYDESLKIKPNDHVIWYNKGIAFVRTNKYDKAILCYDKALEINQSFNAAWYDKACCYSLLKNKSEMLSNLKKAIELNPQFKFDAAKDNDFKEYWNDPEFMELVK